MSSSKGPDDLMLAKRGYTLDHLIGEGSYAKVYTADYSDPKNPEKKQRLACKLINGAQAPKDFIVKFFPREVEIMSRVTHPYVIRVHSILQRKNKYFLFMQYCENGDLLDFIRNNGAVDETQARQWFSQLVKGYYHPDKEPKSETFCGSVSYAAPEIIRGSAYDPRYSDLWSLGIILYIMLNKGMPFDDSSMKKLYEAQITRDWKFRSKVRDKVSPEIKAFMYRLLEPQPDKRTPLEKMTDDPWFKTASQPNVPDNPPYEQPLFPISSTEGGSVPIQDVDGTGGATAVKEGTAQENPRTKSEHEPKPVWSKTRELGTSSTTVKTTQGTVKSKKSIKDL